jgi:hypothetical protein
MRKILHTLLLITYIFCYIKKTDSDSAEINNNKIKNNPNFKKTCEVKENCRSCTFEELKISDECKSTGFKEIKYCMVYDGERLDDDYHTTESCESNKINSIYLYLCFFTTTGILSLLLRKYYRKMMLQSTLEKITIIKDK